MLFNSRRTSCSVFLPVFKICSATEHCIGAWLQDREEGGGGGGVVVPAILLCETSLKGVEWGIVLEHGHFTRNTVVGVIVF